jgi:inosine/xanthosine triphosphate pyrophosphatase family protein
MSLTKNFIPQEFFNVNKKLIESNIERFYEGKAKIDDSGEYVQIIHNYSFPKNTVIYNTKKSKKLFGLKNSFHELANWLDLNLINFYFQINETSNNSTDIATKKALMSFYSSGFPSIASDTGFEIQELDGWPGTKYYEVILDKGIQGVFNKFSGESTSAKWVRSIAYMDESLEKPKTFISETKGFLLKPSSNAITSLGLKNLINGYFIAFGTGNKTVAELSKEEYDLFLKKDKYVSLINFIAQKYESATKF